MQCVPSGLANPLALDQPECGAVAAVAHVDGGSGGCFAAIARMSVSNGPLVGSAASRSRTG